jgi:uncharacterized integral membrane protein
MSRYLGIAAAAFVVLLATAFAAANVGHRATLSLGLFTLYRVPVTLVAFSGLLVGMLVMFATGVHSDLKVRRILRERLAEETRKEQGWIDRNQRDLFAQDPEVEGGNGSGSPPTRESRALSGSREVPNPILTPLPLPPLPGAFPEDRGMQEPDGSFGDGSSSVAGEGERADPPLKAASEEEPEEEGRSE